MKVPPGVTLHHGVRVYPAGAELPPELEALLPEDMRLAAMEAEIAVEPPRARVMPEAESEPRADMPSSGKRGR